MSFKDGMKNFGKGLGEFIDAAAKAADDRRELELQHRAVVENALREYEAAVGKPFVVQTPMVAVPNGVLPWSPTRPGHLINCQEYCYTKHCLTCGREAYGDVFCRQHR